MVSNTGVNEAPRQVAVYWHLENLVSSQYNKMFGSGQWTRDKLNMARKTPEDLSMALGRARVDVKGLVGHAQSLGGLVINRVYADWSVGMFKEYRLGLSAVRPVDFVQVYRSVPVRTDIQLPIDVVADLDRYSGITDVLVCSGTVGFETVATHAEARGRRAHAIGFATGNNASWCAATQFTEYADIAATAQMPPLPAATARALVAPFSGDYSRTLGCKALRSAVTGVDPKALGYPSFWGLLRAAALEGLLEVTGTNQDKSTVRLNRTVVDVPA